MKELDKKYNHEEVENGKYETWLKKNLFKCEEESSKKPFCIVLPPPNVTGVLHLGHAWNVTLQDIIIRYKKMEGYDCLWLPGMDHAAIATEAKVVKRLKDKGINKYEYGREKFLEACWDWTKEHGDIIREQWAKLGIALDYSKERFTLDEGLSKAVRKVFVDYYNEGLIYRGEKIINWDPEAKTALSNEEVIYKEVEGAFYHLKYKLEDSDEYLDVATTRPETLFGDTAVAVNENDKRYQKFVGKNVILPIVNKPIPVITDEHADMEKGTGVVKITPAHDPNDFEVGNRHQLERIVVLNDDGTMNENAGIYQGMSREACREKLVKDLEEQGLLLQIEPLKHEVGHSERTGVMVEPMIKKQWFVRMRPLADHVLEVQKDKKKKVNFVPSRYEKTMNHWMEITYDWCISRQLWWGHRIPAWYKEDEVYVGMEAPKGDGWVQDEDVLDTWFSSALWPFATLGWPDNTKLLEKYYPNQCLVTGYDIIPFWVNRMTFQGEKLLGQRPFEDVLIHGLIRDKLGRKFSKSLGNGIDPFDMIDSYGADALRYYLASDVAPGTDMRFDEEKIKAAWNFINKLWNASRFVLTNIQGLQKISLDYLKNEDKWILTKLEKTIHEVKKFMDKYQFNNAASTIYEFTWNYFCDYYIEIAKYSLDQESTKSTLCYVLTSVLKMLQPFMPFVTEEIYSHMPIKEEACLMTCSYPKQVKKYIFEKEEEAVDDAIEFVRRFRNIKAENNMSKELKVMFDTEDDNNIIVKMLKLDGNIVKQPLGMKAYKVFSKYIKATIFFERVETEADKVLKENQIQVLKASIERREKLLANENYVKKAPEKIVELDRQKLAEEKKKLEELLKDESID
ncbi:MAG: valine--tRNA ligase [Bacilli bacterium]|nr:valine--tRNA ligase [Bacilli bacterium]